MSSPVSPPRKLVLVRHAKSSWAEPGVPDHDRDLNRRGLRIAPLVGRHLFHSGLVPGFVWCSTARRAQRTLQLLAGAWPSTPACQTDPALYLASPAAILEHIRLTPETVAEEPVQSVMVIGHNPGIEELCRTLAGGDPVPGEGHFPTAAVAVFNVAPGVTWSEVAPRNVRLEAFWTPRELFGESD